MAEVDVMRVKRATDCIKLGSAIAHKLTVGENVVLKFIGAAACNQAVKAVIIAEMHVHKKLVMHSTFVDVKMPDLDEPVTGVVSKVLVVDDG